MHCPHIRQSQMASFVPRSTRRMALRNPRASGADVGGLRSSFVVISGLRGYSWPLLLEGCGRDLLLEVDERGGCRLAGQWPALRTDLQDGPRPRELGGYPHVADVPLQPRGPDGVRHLPDHLPVHRHRPEPRQLGAEGVPRELDPDQLALHAFAAEPLQRVLADVIMLLLLDQVLETHDLE